jgi:poly(3-hydroxybutyrate) depolymerase
LEAITMAIFRLAVATVLATLSAACAVQAKAIPPGAGKQVFELDGGVSLTAFTYRPDCREPSLLIVMHGLGRNADEYRDFARPIADRNCMLVVAPLFDKARFPTWRYQRGGIVHQNVVQPAPSWTGHMVLELVEQVRTLEHRSMKYSMIGHSAGGQFLSRLAAFVPSEAEVIVVANPGTHTFATLQVNAPFGMAGVYGDAEATSALRRYLAQPVTILLGEEDTGEENLNEGPEAMAQGSTRHERGLNAFHTAQALANSSSWTFNWRLVEVPGAGHSAPTMFSSPQASAALSR